MATLLGLPEADGELLFGGILTPQDKMGEYVNWFTVWNVAGAV